MSILPILAILWEMVAFLIIFLSTQNFFKKKRRALARRLIYKDSAKNISRFHAS